MFPKTRDAQIIVFLFVGSAALVVVGAGFAYFELREIESPLVLHFNEIAGITQSGGLLRLMGAAVTALSAFAVNAVLSALLYVRAPRMAHAVAYATFFMGLLLSYGFYAIVGVN